MSKSTAYCSLIAAFAVVLVLSAVAPSLLSDSNPFLKGFVDGDGYLNVLGVILAITLASAGQLHLTLIQLEERLGKPAFSRTRTGVRSAAHWLIGLFIVAIVLVVVKPLLAKADWAQSLFNGSALFILLWNVLLLLSLTQGTFAVKPEKLPPTP